MGLTKQYLRYQNVGFPFGVISSSSSAPVIFVNWARSLDSRFVASASCECVTIWDIKTGEKIHTLQGSPDVGEVTALATDDSHLLAVGYSSGKINLFTLNDGSLKAIFDGHKSAVTVLEFDSSSMKLASGSKDTRIIIWDTVSESGLFTLLGHKNLITAVKFFSAIEGEDLLISSSKDTLIKIWDLKTQHCFKTVTGHLQEIHGFILIPEKCWMISATNDSELRIWRISKRGTIQDDQMTGADAEAEDEDESNDDNAPVVVHKIGSILRESVSPTKLITIDHTLRYFTCVGKDSHVEVFKILSEEEIKSKRRKKGARERKRARKSGKELADEGESEAVNLPAKDELERVSSWREGNKVKSVDISCTSKNKCTLVTALGSNCLQVYETRVSIPAGGKACNKGDGEEKEDEEEEEEKGSEEEGEREGASRRGTRKHGKAASSLSDPSCDLLCSLTNEGHRADVRAVTFSSDGYFILTASGDAVKVWSRVSHRCIVTMSTNGEYALDAHFAPGDKNALVTTKEGNLIIYDVADRKLLQSIRVSEHGQPVWSVDLYPNGKGLVTASEDKLVKFWDFDLVQDAESNMRRLTVRHVRTLSLEEGVLAVKISPNFKFIALSLLDSTVKVFFFDTLKFFLSLYGHKFPVLSMDISHDSTLIATGSSDKNIKLWGLDFGDCHKSIFAHEGPVTVVRFVPGTHYLFSGGKDAAVKQWDCDNFEKIITLKGHLSDVWSLAVSHNGKYLVSTSHDKSIRLWERTSEPLVLEEEQEDEREELFAKDAFRDEELVIAGEVNPESTLVGKKSTQTVCSSEILMEAIQVHKSETASQHVAKDANPLMLKFNTTCPDRFVLETLRSIRSSQLEETLISLPFNYVTDLLVILSRLAAKHWEIELVSRCATFLCR